MSDEVTIKGCQLKVKQFRYVLLQRSAKESSSTLHGQCSMHPRVKFYSKINVILLAQALLGQKPSFSVPVNR